MRSIYLILFLAVGGCTAPAGATGPAKGPFEEGHKLYVAKCAKCHKFYNPANYSDQDWKIWMSKMSRKAKLKPEQEAAVSQYIEQVLRGPK